MTNIACEVCLNSNGSLFLNRLLSPHTCDSYFNSFGRLSWGRRKEVMLDSNVFDGCIHELHIESGHYGHGTEIDLRVRKTTPMSDATTEIEF